MLLFFGQIRLGADPGWGRNRSQFFNELLLQTGRLQQRTECIAMWDVVLLLLVPFQSQIFDAFSTSYRTYSHFALFNAISVDFYAVNRLIYIYFICNFHVCNWKNVYIKDLNALRILMNFLWIYLDERGRVCTNACICMGTHSQPLLQNCLMDVCKTWYRWSAHGLAHA